jgi:hypothetical protein
LHKQSVIESEEQKESPSSHPIVDESTARPGKKNGPQRQVIASEDPTQQHQGVIRTEDQAMQPRGVIQTEEQTGPPSKAQTVKLLQRKVGNQRAGSAMATLFGGTGKDTAKPPPITTPLPQGSKREPTGEAILVMAGVKVVVLPDEQDSDPSMQGRAQTHGNLTWPLPGWEEQDGKVTAIETMVSPVLTIKTEYGPGVTAASPSAYGRGTTKEDVKTGRTSLGFHEGNHGLDFMRYVQNHPLPRLMARKGMRVEDFQKARDDYNTKMQAYQSALEAYSKKLTDCVGTPDARC